MRMGSVRCQCRSCGLTFSRLSAFDRHRTGTYQRGGDPRRCLSEDDMRARGMVERGGVWFGRARQAPREVPA